MALKVSGKHWNTFTSRKSSKRQNKYKAKPTNGFPSKLESAVHDILLLRQRAGEIRNIKRQTTVVLQEGGKERRIAWKVDFSFEEYYLQDVDLGWTWRDAFAEAKGLETADYRIKLKLFRATQTAKLYIYKGDYKRPKLVETINP